MVDYLNINAVNVEVTYSNTTRRTVVILLAPKVFYIYHSKSSFLMCISIKYTVNVDVYNLIVWIKHLPKRISNTFSLLEFCHFSSLDKILHSPNRGKLSEDKFQNLHRLFIFGPVPIVTFCGANWHQVNDTNDAAREEKCYFTLSMSRYVTSP